MGLIVAMLEKHRGPLDEWRNARLDELGSLDDTPLRDLIDVIVRPLAAKLDDTDEWIQVGVHSWGDVNCRYESGSTRVDVAWDFIMEQVEAVHGSTDLCEINGRYEDGTCDAWCDAVDPDCVTDEAPVEEDAKACSAVAGTSGLLVVLPGLLALIRRRR